MASKRVTDRQKSAQAVMAIGAAQGKLLSERVGPMLAGSAESAPNVAELVAVLTAPLDAAREEMIAADEAHAIETAGDAASRNRRDEQVAGLYEPLVEPREIATGLFGAPAGSGLFSGRTPRDPVVLALYRFRRPSGVTLAARATLS